METIFDHGVTPEELRDILDDPELTRDAIERFGTQDSAFADIYYLYLERGDKKTAARYLRKIKDPRFRYDTSYCDIVFE